MTWPFDADYTALIIAFSATAIGTLITSFGTFFVALQTRAIQAKQYVIEQKVDIVHAQTNSHLTNMDHQLGTVRQELSAALAALGSAEVTRITLASERSREIEREHSNT